MMEQKKVMGKLTPKVIVLAIVAALGSATLGFLLERLFASGFVVGLSVWQRFCPLIISFLVTVSLLTVLSVVGDRVGRVVGFIISALAFSFPFFAAPHAITIPQPFPFLVPLVYFGGLLLFDYYVQRAVRVHAVFASWIFSSAYAKFFFFFTLVVGILVYFSAQVPSWEQFKIPEGMLDPALDVIIGQVVAQLQSQLGTEQFSQKQFLEELKKSGLLEILEDQFGISLEEEELVSPQELTENLRGPLAEQLTEDLEGFIENFLGPYLPFLPLIVAVGVALSLLFLSPVFSILSVAVFGLIYRGLLLARFARLEEESRQVPVLKIS